MTKLSPLRARLNDLRRRRQTVRWGTAYAALALAVLWTLFATFVIDWMFELGKPQRFLLIAAGVAVVVFAARRFTLPWLGQKESELDIALLVERQQKIDSDLVAAIQFESPEARQWGSTQLESAVIDYVGEFGKGWNILEGFSRQDLVRRASALTATIVLLGLIVIVAPGHARAFLNRLLLGSAHYPTKTSIDQLVINGHPVDVFAWSDATIKSPYGRPVRFEVHSSGELPDQGRVDLKTLASGVSTPIDLTRNKAADGSAVYVGQLPKLVDSLSYQLYLGDAWTDPAEIQLIELPVIDTRLTATPPRYARGVDVSAEPSGGARQISVIEGSKVALQVTCSNKQLKDVVLSIAGQKYPLTAEASADKPGRSWSLPGADTPLARVDKPVHYEIQVTDEDGLQLEHPVQGFIRIKSDQRPRITGDVVTKFVLPSASPLVEYRAMDDFGLAKLLAHVQVSRGDGSLQEQPPLEMKKLAKPILRDKLPAGGIGTYKLNLASFNLVKGDQVKLTLEVIDYRGELPGQSAQSEPLVLQVTDESGVLAAISESDERSARQLDAIIKRQLGIGDQK